MVRQNGSVLQLIHCSFDGVCLYFYVQLEAAPLKPLKVLYPNIINRKNKEKPEEIEIFVTH